MTKKRSQLLNVLKNMPPLHHSVPGEEFNIDDSEMVNWMIEQPEIRSWLGSYLKSIGYTTYDSNTGTHVGIDYVSNDSKCPHGLDWDDCPDCRH